MLFLGWSAKRALCALHSCLPELEHFSVVCTSLRKILHVEPLDIKLPTNQVIVQWYSLRQVFEGKLIGTKGEFLAIIIVTAFKEDLHNFTLASTKEKCYWQVGTI